MKNDIGYEYRVFTNRIFDVESMEVGICTSKNIKEIKPKDKVNGRFFHTSDTDEWYFCWNDELQKLNLKGDSDVNAALAEVEKLIANANAAVSEAKATAAEAKNAAADAKDAADSAIAAVDSIQNKADKSEVESLAQVVAGKVDSSVVDSLSQKVDSKADNTVVDNKADKSVVNALVNKVDSIDMDKYALKSELNDYASKQFVADEIAKIEIPEGADLSGYAKKEFVTDEIAKLDIPVIPTNVSTFVNDANYLTADVADLKYAPIGGEGVDLSDYAKKEFVTDEIAKLDIPTVPTNISAFTNDAGYLTAHQDISGKQDIIDDLATIRANAEKGATALQSVPSEYVTETELAGKGYLTEHQSLDNYYTKKEVDDKLDAINALIGQAIDITNTILA